MKEQCSRSRRSGFSLFRGCAIFFRLMVFLLLTRIGEAANRGPIIWTTNPIGALGKAALYAALPGQGAVPAIWGVSESHLTKPGLARFRQEIAHQSTQWRIVHGFHAPPLSDAPGTIGGKATGVGILSNCPLRHRQIGIPSIGQRGAFK